MRSAIFFSLLHIPTGKNVEADQESRAPHDTEFEFGPGYFVIITNTFGSPSIDFFADRNNAKCRRFISWHRDPNALAIDAFTVDWKAEIDYAFPPFCLIPQVLQKIIQDKARVIVVAPDWPSQPWFPTFLNQVEGDLLRLDPNINLLLSSDRQPHPLWRSLSLVVGILSWKALGEKATRRSPSTS